MLNAAMMPVVMARTAKPGMSDGGDGDEGGCTVMVIMAERALW